MIVLALDTATTDLVVGLTEVDTSGMRTGNDARVVAQAVTTTRAHNEQLVPTVNRLLAQQSLRFADLSAIVVGCGPGPFTGLRVGMATASAFGQALGIPVHGVVTHDAVALGIDAAKALVVTDARRREVYWARYDGGTRVVGPCVSAPAEVDVAGVEIISVPPQLTEQLPAQSSARVTYSAPGVAGLVAAADLSSEPGPLVAHYLRRPDAVEPKPKPRSTVIPEVDLQGLS